MTSADDISLNVLSVSATTVTRTHCPFCAFQCGMTLSADHQIKADELFPVNLGQMCIKGFSSAELLTHPERILRPLIRNASGTLVESSWEEAFDLIASRWKSLREQFGTQSIGAFGSGSLTNEKVYWLGKFVRIALKSPYIDYNGRFCMSSAAAAQNMAFGLDRGLPFPIEDIGTTKALLLWGSNIADTMPPMMQWVAQMKKNGGRFIVVDPRSTETANEADIHLQPVPGTDLALANGLLYLAIDENLIDQKYIDERTNHFAAVRATIQRYHPAYVERLTGVSSALMRQVVRWMAEDTSKLLSGRGPEQQSKGVDTALAMINLMLGLGKCGKPSSGFGTITGQGNGQGGREHGQKADQLPGYRSIDDPNSRTWISNYWGINESDLPHKGLSAVEMFDKMGEPDGIKSLLVMGSNIAVATPNASKVNHHLAKLDFLVVIDSFLNDTSQHAHVILPTTQWAEEEGTLTNLEGRVIRRRQSIEAPSSVKGDIEILSEIASRLGYAKYFQHQTARTVFEEFRNATAGSRADYSGITYAKIDLNNGIAWPCKDEQSLGTPRVFLDQFYHKDGRALFHPVEYREAAELPDADYPIYFTTGRYREHYNSGAQTRRVKRLTDAQGLPRLQIHPRLALSLNIMDGNEVVVESRRGSMAFTVQFTSMIRVDSVFAPFHWGGRQAVNILTNPALDPISKMPEFKICAVRILSPIPTQATNQHV